MLVLWHLKADTPHCAWQIRRCFLSVCDSSVSTLKQSYTEPMFASNYIFPSYDVFSEALSDVVATPSICKEGGSGLFLPVGGDQHQEYKFGAAMCVPYLLGLLWCFMGVGIIADIFMASIETITSQTYKITRPDGEVSEVKVWNATVANLTLMALGSSAPEIILSIIEIISLSVR